MSDELTTRQKLDNLTDFLVEDIMAATDEEIMAEMLEDLGSQEAVDAALERLRLTVDEIVERVAKAKEDQANANT